MCHGIDHWIAEYQRERLELVDPKDGEDPGEEAAAEGADEPLAPAADD